MATEFVKLQIWCIAKYDSELDSLFYLTQKNREGETNEGG
jgi:hypothetical protein